LAGSASENGLDTSSIDDIIGYRLRRAQLAVFTRFAARFAEANLKPADYSALVLIADNPGRKQSVIAAALGIKRTNFVALTEGLARRGLIDRRQPKYDRRSHALHLTREGETLVAAIRKVQQDFESELVAELGGEAARDTLVALLSRLG
jgi:DNA-binding MarR family transcriptional regulator